MPPDLYSELRDGLRAAADGAFRPWFYRVKVSPRRWRRYRMPGVASRVSPQEARAIQAFHVFGGVRPSALARQFHRKRETIARVLRDQAFRAIFDRD
jgi:hypothetical protein